MSCRKRQVAIAQLDLFEQSAMLSLAPQTGLKNFSPNNAFCGKTAKLIAQESFDPAFAIMTTTTLLPASKDATEEEVFTLVHDAKRKPDKVDYAVQNDL